MKIILKAFPVILFALLAIFTSCERQEKKKVSAETIDSLRTVYQAINDSLQTAWDRMIEDDDQKLAYMRRLVQEVSYTNNFDSAEYKAMMDMIDQLASIRYDQKTMESSQLIDKYDSATYETIRRVTAYAQEHPQFENYPLMQELVNDIQQAQEQVFFYRIRYDTLAKSYNAFIEDNEEFLVEIDNTRTDFKQKPLFELPAEPEDIERLP